MRSVAFTCVLALLGAAPQAADLLNNVRGAHGDDRVAALTVLTAWLRLSAQRLLVW